MEKLLAGHAEGEVLQGQTVTPAVLRRGLPLLLNGMVDGVRFDGLQRTAGASRLGDFHYVPILFHENERPTKEQKALLELLGLILGPVQGREPSKGILVHGRDCQVHRVKLGTGVRQARRTLREVTEMSEVPPRLVLNPHCTVCEFRQRCHAEATTKDDLSLLRGMTEKEIAKWARRGIFTVTQLSCTFRPRRKPKHAKRQGQPHQHALQALAVREKKVYILGTPNLPACPTRVFLDIEGDPDRGFDYLLGMIVEADGREQHHSFWADSPAEEPRLFQQFLDVVSRYDDYRLYCYGSYEAAFLRRLVKQAARPDLGEKLLPHVFNVLSVVRSHVYFPIYSNSLKDIAGYLGFRWTEANASGLQSIVWRRRWEQTGSPALKETLTTYNLEDCAALRQVTQFVYAVCPSPAVKGPEISSPEGNTVVRLDESHVLSRMRGWNDSIFAVPDFEYINDRASFDYQRDRVYFRTSKTFKRKRTRNRTMRWKKHRRVNQVVELSSPSCPSCGGTEMSLRQNRSFARLAYDLRITRNGIRGWVTRYRAAWHCCAGCGQRFLPADYLRLQEFCHSLKSWAMYQYVAHRASFPSIADTIRDCFNLPIYQSQVHGFKHLLARYYQSTYQRLMEKLVAGSLIHADETEVHVRQVGKAYVWVFTNLEEVVFLYRSSREGDFLQDLLKDFHGVLVSDFYAAYDSLACPQQKCLVHLLRDFNQDILANPWDEELKSLASGFGSLLRLIVASIDRYGLRQKHLRKHRRDVDRYFEAITGTAYRSEAAEGYRRRLLKYREKLFTFLDHDGIPWNNNNAEHAVKAFAHYREVVDSLVTEPGLSDYLVLLSIQQTCKFKGVSFLKFLLSRQADIDMFREGRERTAVPVIEVYPEGNESGRQSRKRLGGQAAAGKP
jgi:predicted RecB family nuclease